MYQALADAVLVLHFAFIAFVLGGGLLVRRWPRLAWLHVPAVAWGAAIEIMGWVCPLTPLENHFRALAGRGLYSGDFVERYLLPLIYPAGLTSTIQLMLGGGVIVLNGIIYARIFRARRNGRGQA